METFRNVFNDLENKVHQLVCFADESARGTADGAVNVSMRLLIMICYHSKVMHRAPRRISTCSEWKRIIAM